MVPVPVIFVGLSELIYFVLMMPLSSVMCPFLLIYIYISFALSVAWLLMLMVPWP